MLSRQWKSCALKDIPTPTSGTLHQSANLPAGSSIRQQALADKLAKKRLRYGVATYALRIAIQCMRTLSVLHDKHASNDTATAGVV